MGQFYGHFFFLFSPDVILTDLPEALKDFYDKLEIVLNELATAPDELESASDELEIQPDELEAASDDPQTPIKRRRLERELENVFHNSEAGACLLMAIQAPEFFKYSAIMYPKRIGAIHAAKGTHERLETMFLEYPHYLGFNDVSL